MTESYAKNRTKSHFKLAFIRLIKEIGYSNINVKNLVAAADYNRTSFYKYYNNLDEITDDLSNDILNHFSTIIKKNHQITSIVDLTSLTTHRVNIFEEIHKMAHYYDLLVVEDTLPQLNKRFIQLIEIALTKEIFFLTPEFKVYNNEYLINFRAFGTYAFIKKWIENRYSTEPTVLAADIVKIYTQSFIYSKKVEDSNQDEQTSTLDYPKIPRK